MANQSRYKSLSRIAPLLTLGLLVAIGVRGRITPERNPNAAAYFESVKLAVESLPLQVGSYTGRDTPVQPAAQELLKPNVVMQRRYTDPVGGGYVDVLIVHCGDVRDMIGHFPPVCYPANGWLASKPQLPQPITVGPHEATAMSYRYERQYEGRTSSMTILNFFISPNSDAPISRDLSDVERAAGSVELAGLGAAQVQILTPAGMQNEDRLRIESMFVEALEPVVRAISTPPSTGGEPRDGENSRG